MYLSKLSPTVFVLKVKIIMPTGIPQQKTRSSSKRPSLTVKVKLKGKYCVVSSHKVHHFHRKNAIILLTAVTEQNKNRERLYIDIL